MYVPRGSLWPLLALLSLPAIAQTTPAQYPIVGNLGGVSSTSNLLQVRFSVVNCGTADPQIPGVTVVVDKQKTFTADVNGNITGTLWGNDQIACNLGFSTEYQITYLINNIPTGIPHIYRITAPAAGTSWNLNSAIPIASLPPVNLPLSGYKCPAGQVMTGILANWQPACAIPTPAQVGSVLQVAPANQTVLQAPGTTLSVSSLNQELNADAFLPASTDIGAKVNAADLQLVNSGATSGVIGVHTAGTMSTAITLSPGHSVKLSAPLTATQGIILGAHTAWHCENQGAAITVAPSANIIGLFNQVGTADAAVTDCTVHGSTTYPGNYLINLQGTTDKTKLSHNTVDSMGLFSSNFAAAVTGLEVTNNIDTYPATSGANAPGVYAFWVKGARISGNSFINTYHGVQWWGGNASGFTVGGLAGNMQIVGNHCSGVFASCVWGSNGQDITVTGNSSIGSGDVAFDAEGGLRVSFVGNTASACGNGCGAWFYSASQVLFSANNFDATGSTGFFGRNSSVDPTKQNGVHIASNIVNCTALCAAAAYDAMGNFSIEGNEIVNGTITANSYGTGDVLISRNRLLFNVAVPSGTAAIVAPKMLTNGTALLEGNMLRAAAGATGASGFNAASSDFNSANVTTFRKNTVRGFPTAISTTSAGGNYGVPTYWNIEGTQTDASPAFVHTIVNPNEVYRVTPDNITLTGTRLPQVNVDQIVTQATCTTAATVGAQCTTSVTMPNPAPGGIGYPILCTLYAGSGVPSLVNYNSFTGTGTFNVVIQATTAVAANGTAVCRQSSAN